MTTEESKVEVLVRYRGMEVKLNGSADEVTRAFLEFMEKMLPGLELVSRLVLTVDLEKLLNELQGIIAITDEGIIVTSPRELRRTRGHPSASRQSECRLPTLQTQRGLPLHR